MANPIVKGPTFASGDQVTATKLNNLVDLATFDSDAVDNVTLQVSSDTLSVKDGGVTPAKLSTGKPSWDSSGNTTITGQVIISGASAGQIVFPATQNASANANTLDDYEEGTWTPSLGGTATYTTQTGTYTKIGRVVTAHCRLAVNVLGSGSTSVISGLPFAASFQQAGTVGYFASAVSNFVFVSCYATASSTIQVTVLTAAGATTGAGTAFFGDSTDIMLTVVYHV